MNRSVANRNRPHLPDCQIEPVIRRTRRNRWRTRCAGLSVWTSSRAGGRSTDGGANWLTTLVTAFINQSLLARWRLCRINVASPTGLDRANRDHAIRRRRRPALNRWTCRTSMRRCGWADEGDDVRAAGIVRLHCDFAVTVVRLLGLLELHPWRTTIRRMTRFTNRGATAVGAVGGDQPGDPDQPHPRPALHHILERVPPFAVQRSCRPA